MTASIEVARAEAGVGDLLRKWRERRGISQLALALRAEVSARHLSFLETGRSQPSREMVLHLAEQLDLPLRERNALLLAAGYAPHFEERSLDDPGLTYAREAIERLLRAHEPYPALALDRHWNVVSANAPVRALMGMAAPHLLHPPVNVLRVSLHPEGLAPSIGNLSEWREHLLARVRRQVARTADPELVRLLEELEGYPVPAARQDAASTVTMPRQAVVIPLQLNTPVGALNLISTAMVFGTPLDITLSELAVETFFPADAATGEALRLLGAAHANDA